MMKKIVPTRLIRRDSHPELPIDPDAIQPGQYRWPPHFTPLLLTVVFVGGCVGASARYWVAEQLPATNGWPLATLSVNLLGAFLLGLLLEGLVRIGDDRGAQRLVRLAVGTGCMGALTTYSSFAADICGLIQRGHIIMAVTYACITIVGGLVLGAIGIWTATSHHKRRERQL